MKPVMLKAKVKTLLCKSRESRFANSKAISNAKVGTLSLPLPTKDWLDNRFSAAVLKI